MDDILTVVAVTSGAFIATNLDNLVLLVALYSRYLDHSSIVTLGYISGMIVIGLISLFIGIGGGFIPIAQLGWLGFIPIMMGIIALLQLFRTEKSEPATGYKLRNSGSAIFAAVLLIQLSNGSDSIITFSVFLADSTPATDYLIALTFLAMIGVFAGLAYYSLSHRRLSEVLDRFGRYITPVILILVGFYIVSNTASDLVPG